MDREMLGDLSTLVVVAEEGNFTRAAHRLGVSQSAVSHTVRRLEDKIGVRLLNRNTRKVTPTDAGEQLLASVQPGYQRIESRIEEIRTLGEKPSGLVRVTSSVPATRDILWPVASQLVRDYPDVRIEISSEGRLADLAEDSFDCAIRLGEHLSPDMIAVPVGPQLQMAAIASPDYLARRGVPAHPDDFETHDCILMRHRSDGPIYDWEFEVGGVEIVKKLKGPFILNDPGMVMEAVRSGHGIGYLPMPEVLGDLDGGRLKRVLSGFCPPFDGYHLCYMGRRNLTSAMRLLIDRLRAQNAQW